jgi:hypothetical protein
MLLALEVNKGAIFKDVGHALHTAYLVTANEPRQGCVTRSMLLQAMTTGVRKLSAEQAEWFDSLKGSPAGTIDFSGLTDDEIRAQCAMVVAAVNNHLPIPEAQVVRARFGANEYYDDDGVRRYGFARERGAAILGLSKWMQTLVTAVSPMAVDMILARHFADHSRTKVTLRQLAASFGGNHMTYKRASDAVVEHLRQLEAKAHGRLHPHFVKQGIIPERRELSTGEKND